MARPEDWLVVFRTIDQVEIELIRGLLATNGFPVVVEKTGFKSMTVFLGESASGEYLLRVPKDRAEEAEALLAAEVQEIEPDYGDDEEHK